jgi:hypothetical protein
VRLLTPAPLDGGVRGRAGGRSLTIDHRDRAIVES